MYKQELTKTADVDYDVLCEFYGVNWIEDIPENSLRISWETTTCTRVTIKADFTHKDWGKLMLHCWDQTNDTTFVYGEIASYHQTWKNMHEAGSMELDQGYITNNGFVIVRCEGKGWDGTPWKVYYQNPQNGSLTLVEVLEDQASAVGLQRLCAAGCEYAGIIDYSAREASITGVDTWRCLS